METEFVEPVSVIAGRTPIPDTISSLAHQSFSRDFFLACYLGFSQFFLIAHCWWCRRKSCNSRRLISEVHSGFRFRSQDDDLSLQAMLQIPRCVGELIAVSPDSEYASFTRDPYLVEWDVLWQFFSDGNRTWLAFTLHSGTHFWAISGCLHLRSLLIHRTKGTSGDPKCFSGKRCLLSVQCNLILSFRCSEERHHITNHFLPSCCLGHEKCQITRTYP